MTVISLAPRRRRAFRLTGWHVLAMLVSFFAVVIGVDVAFTVLAVRTFPGQVSVTPYEDGLLYNKKLEQIAAQERLGWRAAAAPGADVVAVEMRDAQDRPLGGLTLRGRLERPATEVGKISLAFREAAPGRYVADAKGLAGTWDLTVFAHDAGQNSFEAERRLTWR